MSVSQDEDSSIKEVTSDGDTLPKPARVRTASIAMTFAKAKDGSYNVKKEGVEAENELAVAVEELQHAIDDAGGVDALRLELLHDVEELRVK